ncbi:hypothetical protein BKA69DRAFT_1039800 [Paraphysoderma sedebokerense]|nr:hypothetical protein BKA69DRAFT_1039800 [Paraphysoderma sedebokerense]
MSFDLYTSTVVATFVVSFSLFISRASLTGLTADGKSGIAITIALISTMMATIFNLLVDHAGLELPGLLTCLWISQLFYWPARVSKNYYLFFRANNVTSHRYNKFFLGAFLLTATTDFIWTIQVLVSSTIASTDSFVWVSFNWSSLLWNLSRILFLVIVEAAFLQTIWTNRKMIRKYKQITMERLAVISSIRMFIISILALINTITDISGADASGAVYAYANIIEGILIVFLYVDLNIKFYVSAKTESAPTSVKVVSSGTQGAKSVSTMNTVMASAN